MGDKASVVVELALVFPVFIFIIFISLESARIQMVRLLLQRSIYVLAYELKIDQDRGNNFKTLAENILQKRENGFFKSDKVKIEVFSANSLNKISSEAEVGCGGPNDVVLLRFTVSSVGLLSDLGNLLYKDTPTPEVFNYYYINEPQI
jgi:hypothetical protein